MTRTEYGIFLKPADSREGARVTTLPSLAEVGRWMSQVPEDDRQRYVVRQRTVTETPWVELGRD